MSTELALLIFGYFLPMVVNYIVVRKYVIEEEKGNPTFLHVACVIMPIINFIVFGAIITYFFEWLFVKSNFIQRAVKWFFLIK
jgi:hypothetical protein